MTDFLAVRMPQSGPNDATATLVEWNKANGQPVYKGEIVATAETTKSVFEIEAPAGGYLTVLAALGEEVAIGALIAVLSAEPVDVAQARAWVAALETPSTSAAPASAKAWTVKAELLAQRHGIAVADVPAAGERVTEADVQAYLASLRRQPAAPPEVADLVDERYPQGRVQRLLIVGGGNGAVQILDVLARTAHQRAVAILDDNAALHGKRIAGVPIVGALDADRAAELFAAGEFDAAVISVSTSIPFRARVFAEWQARGIPFANVIHPSAVVGMNVQWGEGNVVMALSHIGPCAVIGDNNFLSACCSIEHHNVLGSHCSFGPAVVTSSRVRIGDRVRFGTGIFVEPGIEIGADSVIASGLALTQHVPERSLVKAKVGYMVRRR